MVRFCPLLVLFLFLASCADTHHLVRNTTSSTRLSPAESVYIAVPEDGFYNQATYRGSGRTTAQIIFNAFVRHIHAVSVGRSAQQYAQALAEARRQSHRYLVYPVILHWEDRATEWSCIPDKVEVKIEVIDTAFDTVVASGIVQGRSGLATLGGDHPQDLLPEPMAEFVAGLY